MGIIPILSYSDGLKQLAEFAVKRELIPFFGAGFTFGCPSCERAVSDFKQEMAPMQQLILQATSEIATDELETLNFYDLSDLFFRYVSKEERSKYFEQNYTDVTIYQNQKNFLSAIDWPYAYTLNVDNGIKRNSQFKPILPYHKLHRPHTSKKLLYKLHGDALYESQYAETAENIVFSQL